MTNSWDLVNYYRTTPGVVHKKSGWVLAKITSTMRLERLMDEVIELIGAPHDLKRWPTYARFYFTTSRPKAIPWLSLRIASRIS